MRRAKLAILLLLMSALSEVTVVLATIASIVIPKADYVRWLLLGAVARTRFQLGLLATSKRLAAELLRQAENHVGDWNYGNAIHQANSLLGRIALRQGDLIAAKRYLIASGQTQGSPNLASFGPNMTLAKELIEAGEVATVLEYFSICSMFWEDPFGLLDLWENDIRQGRKPNFGANLYY